MTWFDFAALITLGVSILIGIWRGLVREVVSLLGWIAGFALAMVFGDRVARMLPESLGPLLAGLLGFLLIFLGVMIAAAVVQYALSAAVRAARIGNIDRVLGAVFGCARGVIIVLVLVLLGGLTGLPRDPWWRDAFFSAPVERAALVLRPYLPEGLAQRLKYR